MNCWFSFTFACCRYCSSAARAFPYSQSILRLPRPLLGRSYRQWQIQVSLPQGVKRHCHSLLWPGGHCRPLGRGIKRPLELPSLEGGLEHKEQQSALLTPNSGICLSRSASCSNDRTNVQRKFRIQRSRQFPKGSKCNYPHANDQGN